jgi:cbb3-type cytochrome oxidase maturation protein
MEILYLLIPVSIVLVFLIGALFWWALNNQQFDGLDDEANRIFSEDDIVVAKPATPSIDALKPKNPTQ